jgi:hypothetical protein
LLVSTESIKPLGHLVERLGIAFGLTPAFSVLRAFFRLPARPRFVSCLVLLSLSLSLSHTHTLSLYALVVLAITDPSRIYHLPSNSLGAHPSVPRYTNVTTGSHSSDENQRRTIVPGYIVPSRDVSSFSSDFCHGIIRGALLKLGLQGTVIYHKCRSSTTPDRIHSPRFIGTFQVEILKTS